MGSVWEACHLALETTVAVKLMAPELLSNPSLRARFEREAKAAAQLKSPHIVQVHDFGIDGATPFIVMELLSGEDLGAFLRRRAKLDLETAADLLRQIARGLATAHARGVVHRDLKPSNLFLIEVHGDPVVKILDFGIAKVAPTLAEGGEVTTTTDVIGSPAYMSPEQLRAAKDVDHRSDLWSLAVILFRMLTARLPFPGKTMSEVVLEVCSEPIPTARTFAPELPVGMDAFFARALARPVEERYPSIEELYDAFVRAAGIRPDPSTSGKMAGSVPDVAAISAAGPDDTTPLGAHGTLTGAGSFVTPGGKRARRRQVLRLAGVSGAVVIGAVAALYTWHDPGSGPTSAAPPAASGTQSVRTAEDVTLAPSPTHPDVVRPAPIESAAVAAPSASASSPARAASTGPGSKIKTAPPPKSSAGRINLGL
jgi:serine/threonine-protein kinase